MAEFFVNLKRFEVPRRSGGLCPVDNPQEWISTVIQTGIELGLGQLLKSRLVFLLPEGLVSSALNVLETHPKNDTRTISIGCQGVHWLDIEPGKNFGAFTSSLPARAAAALGCRWSIIGHSEERRAKLQVIEAYDPGFSQDPASTSRALGAVDHLVRDEVNNALQAGLNVLLCVGETAAEHGEGDFSEQKSRIQAVLQKQVIANLQIDPETLALGQIVIGYEPVWAIGPGKIPPGAEYIAFVSAVIKKATVESFGFDPIVIYGGGLKEENAAMIAGISTIGGGLVALTRFTGEIGFDVHDLSRIIQQFQAAKRS